MSNALRLLSYILALLVALLTIDSYAELLPGDNEQLENATAQITTVEQLLQRDMQQALKNSQQNQSLDKSLVLPVLAPRLVALYGVGKSLMAEIQVGNQAYLYIRGQPYPAGYRGDNRVYRLVAMNGACVQLEKGEDKHSLCLRMLLGEDKS